MGADLEGNPIIPHHIQPPAPSAAVARKLREFEKQRAHVECDLETMFEHSELIAKTTLDLQIDEVKRQTIGRALKNAGVSSLEELEALRPGSIKKIDEKTTEAFIQKSVANATGAGYKDVPVEELGWDKTVILRGVPGERYPVKDFLERFEMQKGGTTLYQPVQWERVLTFCT